MKSKNAFRRRSKTRAFSLVEVVLALGVTSFALLGMVTLLPMGIRTSHLATDAMTESLIVQYCRNQLETTTYSKLDQWGGTSLYFDNQGLPTTTSDPEQIYTVNFAVGNVMLSTNGNPTSVAIVNTPGANNSATTAQLVTLTLVNRTFAGSAATNVFPLVVPNTGL